MVFKKIIFQNMYVAVWHSRPPPLHGKIHLKFPFWFLTPSLGAHPGEGQFRVKNQLKHFRDKLFFYFPMSFVKYCSYFSTSCLPVFCKHFKISVEFRYNTVVCPVSILYNVYRHLKKYVERFSSCFCLFSLKVIDLFCFVFSFLKY